MTINKYPNHVEWNKNLKFDETYDLLRTALISTSQKNHKFKRVDKKVKIAILLICLRNGCRLSEGINAYNLYIECGLVELKTRVMKRGFKYEKLPDGKRKRTTTSKEPDEPVLRKILIPDEVKQTLPRYNKSKANVSIFAVRHFGLNPHSLRYCFITHLGKDKGIAAQLIAKMTMHAGINEIIRYTEQSVADDILKTGVL